MRLRFLDKIILSLKRKQKRDDPGLPLDYAAIDYATIDYATLSPWSQGAARSCGLQGDAGARGLRRRPPLGSSPSFSVAALSLLGLPLLGLRRGGGDLPGLAQKVPVVRLLAYGLHPVEDP